MPDYSGTVAEIVNHGTIVSMLIDTDDGLMELIHWDHRPFWTMHEAEEGDVLGRRVAVTCEGPFQERVDFVD